MPSTDKKSRINLFDKWFKNASTLANELPKSLLKYESRQVAEEQSMVMGCDRSGKSTASYIRGAESNE